MAIDPPPPSRDPEQHGLGAALRGLLPQVVPTLIAAVGAVGFVTVVGGAITWNRFNAVELPADQAVAALPESELVAIGLGALVVFLLIGAGAVVLISQVEHRGPHERRWGLLTLVAGGMIYAILLVPDAAPEGRIGLPPEERLPLIALILVAWALAFVLLGWRSEARSRALFWLVFGPVGARGGGGKRALLRRICGLRPYRESGGWFRTVLTVDRPAAAWRLMIVLFAAELLFAALLWQLHDPWLGATLLIGGILGAICVLIGDRPTEGFAGYGLAIFLAVVVFGGATEAMDARYEPEVQPAALLRVGEERGKGLCGLYVTENDERVYLGRLRPQSADPTLPAKDSGRIFFVARKDVAALSIGPLMSIEAAVARASQLRAELVTDALQRAPTMVETRTSRRNGVTIEQRRTREVTRAPGASSQDPPVAAAPPLPSQDRELEARRREAELSCAPPPTRPSG